MGKAKGPKRSRINEFTTPACFLRFAGAGGRVFAEREKSAHWQRTTEQEQGLFCGRALLDLRGGGVRRRRFPNFFPAKIYFMFTFLPHL